MKLNPDQQLLWEFDCRKWRGRILKGPDAHWCYDWDELPVDARTPEYDCCTCYPKTKRGRLVNKVFMFFFNRREEWTRFKK